MIASAMTSVLSLLGYTWKLWNEDKLLSLVDATISNPCFQVEILRCIQVGLLCVQENPEHRPTISMVISMLDSEVIDLPYPVQPGFPLRRISRDIEIMQGGQQYCILNFDSQTRLTGR